jgi:hypothetical protein
MKKCWIVSFAAVTTLTGIFSGCDSGTNNPSSGETLGQVILEEGFEGNLENYRQLLYETNQSMMTISSNCAKSGKSSLTSESNNSSIKVRVDPSIDDSIAGLQFYLMATKFSHTNFYAALCKPGSSSTGLVTFFGIGVDKSDSLKYIYEDLLNGEVKEHKNFAALQLNKWYKCKIEYDYSDTTLTYFLDDAIIRKKPVPNPMTLQVFVAIRDSLGANGSSGYYLDDVKVYKR